MWGQRKPLPWGDVNCAGSLQNSLGWGWSSKGETESPAGPAMTLAGMHPRELKTGPQVLVLGVGGYRSLFIHTDPANTLLPPGGAPAEELLGSGTAPPSTHFPLAECLAVILSSSFLPVLRSCLPSMEPVCTALSGSQKVICEFSVATASSAPSGRKVTARAEKRRGIRAEEDPGLRAMGHAELPSSRHPEGLGAAGRAQGITEQGQPSGGLWAGGVTWRSRAG